MRSLQFTACLLCDGITRGLRYALKGFDMLRRNGFTFFDENVIIGRKDYLFFSSLTYRFADLGPCLGLSLTSRLKIALTPLLNFQAINCPEALLTLANGIIALDT